MIVHESQSALNDSLAVHPEKPGRCAILDREIFETLHTTLPTSALQEIFAIFLADTRQRLAVLAESKAAGSMPHVVHSIRGSAGMIGAVAIAALAERLECDPEAPGRMLEACEQLQLTLRAEGLSL